MHMIFNTQYSFNNTQRAGFNAYYQRFKTQCASQLLMHGFFDAQQLISNTQMCWFNAQNTFFDAQGIE